MSSRKSVGISLRSDGATVQSPEILCLSSSFMKCLIRHPQTVFMNSAMNMVGVFMMFWQTTFILQPLCSLEALGGLR